MTRTTCSRGEAYCGEPGHDDGPPYTAAGGGKGPRAHGTSAARPGRLGVTTSGRLIGQVLRRYRTAEPAKMTLRDAGELLGCAPSTISRWETGERGILPEDIEELLDAYGAPSRTVAAVTGLAGECQRWAGTYLPPAWADLLGLTCSAARVTSYEACQVPLLAADPAEAADEADPVLDPLARTDLAAAIRQAQGIVLRAGGPGIRLVIGETARARLAPGQAARLREIRDRAEIRVLSPGCGPHPAPWAGSMTLLEFDPATGMNAVAHIGGPAGGLLLDDSVPAAEALEEIRDTAMRWTPASENTAGGHDRNGPRGAAPEL